MCVCSDMSLETFVNPYRSIGYKCLSGICIVKLMSISIRMYISQLRAWVQDGGDMEMMKNIG